MPPPFPQSMARGDGLAAQLAQLMPIFKTTLDRLKPLIDQPVIRFPYTLSSARDFKVDPGVRGARIPDTDFIHALEWPFEIQYVKFSIKSGTNRMWKILIKDQTFNQDWMKTSTMVELLVKNNTGTWDLPYPWTVRPKGGGLTVNVDNIADGDPPPPNEPPETTIIVNINFVGYLLIPRV